jgi:hypothetical protein
MNEISNKVKTHAIITWSKGAYFITENQHREVMKLGLNDSITIDGCTLFGKSIAEIITVDEKKKRDNDLRELPPDYYQNYTGVDKTLVNMTPERRRNALDKIHKGFMKHFEGRPVPICANTILKNMQFKMDTQDWSRGS